MIREIFNKKVVDNYSMVVEIVKSYFGHVYNSEFEERSNNTSISLVRGKGIVKTIDGEIYVGEEPVCIKETDGSQIIMPLNFLEDKYGNVVFAHLVLHTLFNDSLKTDYSELNEVIVDYIADDIAKIMRNKNVNVTLEREPCYDSNSVYSQCFDIISEYCVNNKRKLVDELVRGDASKLKKMDELSMLVEQRINSFAFEEVPQNKFKK